MFVTPDIHLCTMNHEKKSFKSCNPEILHHEICNAKYLHHENKMGKKYTIDKS
jgi:hypothetical protein